MKKNNNNKKRNNNKNRGRAQRYPPATRILGYLNERVPRNLPIPNVMRVTLKYSDYFILTSSSGIAYATYGANNLNDPDIDFGGHQPYYYDRYAALYSYYTVLGSRIKIMTNVDTGSNQGVVVGLIAYKNNDVANTTAGLREIMESKFGTYKLFINNPVQAYPLSLSQKSATMLCTTESELISNPTYRTLVAANPSSDNAWYYKILATNVDATVTSFGLAMTIQLEYDVLFTVPKDESPSLKIYEQPLNNQRTRKCEAIVPPDAKSEKSDKSFETVRSVRVNK